MSNVRRPVLSEVESNIVAESRADLFGCLVPDAAGKRRDVKVNGGVQGLREGRRTEPLSRRCFETNQGGDGGNSYLKGVMAETRLCPLHVGGDGGSGIAHRRFGKSVTCVANCGLGGREVGVVRIDDVLGPCPAARLLLLSGSPLR